MFVEWVNDLAKHNEYRFIGEEQEWASVKIMMSLFYIIIYGFDLIDYCILPFFPDLKFQIGLPKNGINGTIYIVVAMLFPLAFYLKKIQKVYWIKYTYFFTFQLLISINDIIITGSKGYQGGNLFDVVLVLISPIFLNKRFFWIISIGAALKYLLVGIILQEKIVVLPILFIIIFMIGSSIIISRLIKYIYAVKSANMAIAQSEKLAAIGELAAGITHEIRNPLSSLKGFLQLNKDSIEDNHYEIMVKEINRINNITSELLQLAKPHSYQIKKINILEATNYSLDLLKGNIDSKEIIVDIVTDRNLPLVSCAEGQIIQVFVNVIKNSIEAMETGGKLKIEILNHQEKIEVKITDTGIGISEADIPKVGDSFFTTKIDGTGLGISICKKIIQEHKGSFDIKSKKNEGTTVFISLPLY